MNIVSAAVTGASGMVGRHLIARLAARGIEVRSSSRTVPADRTTAQWSRWDLSEWKSIEELDRIFPDTKVLFHLGALAPQRDASYEAPGWFDANVRACLCLGDWASRRDVRVIYLSGAIVYADADGESAKNEESALSEDEKLSAYGFAKLLGERVFAHMARQGLHTTVLRATSVYGAGQAADKLVPTLLGKAARDEDVIVMPPVDDRFNLIHADDVARAMIDAAEKEVEGVFNVGARLPVRIHDVAEACVDVTGCGRVLIDARAADRAALHRYNVDSAKARDAFGFESRVSLRDGIERTHRSICFHEASVSSMSERASV